MITPFFSWPANVTALAAEAAKWPGTPFAHYGAVAGPKGGASCHCLVGAILNGVGFKVETLPRVRVTWAKHHTGGLMLPWFRARGTSFAEIKPPFVASILPGDVIIAHLDGLCAHHCGLALPGEQIIHCLPKLGVHTTALGDPNLHTKIAGVFRPLEP